MIEYLVMTIHLKIYNNSYYIIILMAIPRLSSQFDIYHFLNFLYNLSRPL